MGARTLVLVGVFVAAPLSGCPGGAELEDPDRFERAGAAGTAGAAGNAGMAGMAGSAGAAGSSVTFVPPNCDYRGVLASSCGIPACHQTTTSRPASADLDLKAGGIEERVFGKRPSYKDMTCPNPDGGVLPVACVPPGCDPNAFLVAPGDPTQSYLFEKIAGTHGDCGRLMPLAPGKLDEAGRACLEDWIAAVSNATVTP